jgi:hypothetical protein
VVEIVSDVVSELRAKLRTGVDAAVRKVDETNVDALVRERDDFVPQLDQQLGRRVLGNLLDQDVPLKQDVSQYKVKLTNHLSYRVQIAVLKLKLLS